MKLSCNGQVEMEGVEGEEPAMLQISAAERSFHDTGSRSALRGSLNMFSHGERMPSSEFNN